MSFHTGFIAVIGRPNAGKSTIINAFLGQKIASVSPRAQTTRRRQLGILTTESAQLIFVDTPGLHQPRHKLGEFLNQEAEEALEGVNVILWLIDGVDGPADDEDRIADLLLGIKKRPALVIALNKIDQLPPEKLTAKLQTCGELIPGAEVLPLSATRGDGRAELLAHLESLLPEAEAEFDPEQITDLYEREIAVELIREACLIHLRDEVPHGVNVRLDEFTERGEVGAYIAATIFVERDSQKGILIGEGGSMLKRIGFTARKEIEAMSARKVFLELRIKVEKDWRDDENILRRFGYKLKGNKKK
ncbi:MAG: GTPase Era [Anaerolineae bacterium CG_4_9_14_3_um_filter_57_17]|nr:GTPase Era [bacterium]NCT19632.1 GTPase Era [bacterium]OIO87418.1 MAG: GTPase Era [Anaerolineae bacterium CG2_30_57_67]PJB66057.1 MAG: GTPase Era [Anaerolineae bacterium CG_4_9_14_3_um_filter_57_17]